MDQEVLFQNNVGTLYAIQNNFLYLKYAEGIELQRDDFEIFVIHLSEYASENGKIALIVEIPKNTTYSTETTEFITNRKYQGRLTTAIALVGSLELRTADSDKYHANLEGIIPSKSFLSFIEAFQWIQQYVPV